MHLFTLPRSRKDYDNADLCRLLNCIFSTCTLSYRKILINLETFHDFHEVIKFKILYEFTSSRYFYLWENFRIIYFGFSKIYKFLYGKFWQLGLIIFRN